MQITNKGIRTVLKDIESGHLILPALQREFVWKRRDIENLFDSLLQGFSHQHIDVLECQRHQDGDNGILQVS